MKSTFRIQGLAAETFLTYFEMSESTLAENKAYFIIADSKPGYPCRVSLREAEVGEKVLVVPYVHHDVETPYRASGPIFVAEHSNNIELKAGEIPEVLKRRMLSVRAYDASGNMKDAVVCQGEELTLIIEQFFSESINQYLHIHNANPGCFACSVIRC